MTNRHVINLSELVYTLCVMNISQLPFSQRPREKMLNQGIDFLTTEELLTIILGSGTQHISVTTLAKKIKHMYECKQSVSVNNLMEIKGVGLAKACQIVAALELVERLRPRIPEVILDNAQKVLLHVHELRSAEREHIIALYLNARNTLMHKEVLSIGAINQASITPREVFSVIKQHPCLSVILVHNHPTDEVTPSQDDLLFTKRIQQAGDILCVKLIDHIIIGKTRHYSMKAHNML